MWDLDEGLLRGTSVPRTPRDLDALVALAGETDAVISEDFSLLGLVEPHGYWEPVFLSGQRVAYSDGARLRIVEVQHGSTGGNARG